MRRFDRCEVCGAWRCFHRGWLIDQPFRESSRPGISRASARFGPLVLVWLDLWNNRYGLAIEATFRRRVWCVSVGFGHWVKFGRGWA